VANSPAPDWSVERRREYIDWATGRCRFARHIAVAGTASLIKLLTVLFSRLIHRWQVSRISALATPTFDVRYWVKFGKHLLI
jgi:hypothetical protein